MFSHDILTIRFHNECKSVLCSVHLETLPQTSSPHPWMKTETTSSAATRGLMQETEWSVRKTSIAWSTLDAEPQTSPPPMVQ
ncbi:hypothetical protein TNCV_1176291 [Trichonephila clavipes]|nr:hypothetical protein TNCV_1176291 [Trichonephila clavipes]